MSGTFSFCAKLGDANLVTSSEYDAMGRVFRRTLPDAGIVHSEFNLKGQLVKTWGARTTPVSYTYELDQIKSMTTWKDLNSDSGKAVTTWNYDSASRRLASKVLADGSSTSYTYTAGGQLLTRTDAKGIVTTYAYSNAGELTSTTYSDSTPAITHIYNRLGQKVQSIDGVGARVFSYHDEGDLESEEITIGVLDDIKLSYTHDALLRPSGYDLKQGATSLLGMSHTSLKLCM